MNKIKLENLSKRYGKRTAIDGITCEFSTGINALLGPNGAGKTTIMNCISGVISVTGGKITYNDKDVFSMGEEYRSKLSFQFQSQPFYLSYTAHDFLEFSALLKGMDKADINKEIKRVLSLVNLSENENDKIKSFSGGMKQRLAIAQTILNSPEILIFDEPSAGLDPFEREQFKRIMMQMKEQSIIIISTHIVSDIDTICDNLIILNKGSVIANNKPEILCERIKGKVWSIPKEDIKDIPFNKIYFEDTDSKTISKTKPTEHAVISKPTLNDLYFCGQLNKNIFSDIGGDDE